ncbi:MAG TPA: hypothetical protein VNU01_02900 [Egibacteraceae bacterium]|nr:hypothetical protein [Egibacteraceae bacterium]
MRGKGERLAIRIRGGRGGVGVAAGAAVATLAVGMLAAGLMLQRFFDPEVMGALSVLVWPAWLLGAMLTFFGLVAFAIAVVSTAAGVGLSALRGAPAQGSAGS